MITGNPLKDGDRVTNFRILELHVFEGKSVEEIHTGYYDLSEECIQARIKWALDVISIELDYKKHDEEYADFLSRHKSREPLVEFLRRNRVWFRYFFDLARNLTTPASVS